MLACARKLDTVASLVSLRQKRMPQIQRLIQYHVKLFLIAAEHQVVHFNRRFPDQVLRDLAELLLNQTSLI